MDNFTRFIPNLLTLANLASGMLAVLAIFSGDYTLAAVFLGASLLFDVLDGLTARALGVHSDLGIQLDSLADLVSFGVSPGFLMFHLLGEASADQEMLTGFLPYIALLIPLFSALRLAKFNIDTRQTNYFIGMPTPANAMLQFSVALWAVHTGDEAVRAVLMNPFFLAALLVVSSVLLVAELPLMSLKIKSFKVRDNLDWLTFGVVFLLLLLVFGFLAVVFIIPLYLLLSLIFKPERK